VSSPLIPQLVNPRSRTGSVGRWSARPCQGSSWTWTIQSACAIR